MTNLLPVGIYLTVLAGLATWSVRTGLGRLNPMTVFAGIWSVVLIVYQLPALDLLPISSETYWFLFVATAAFAAGVLVGSIGSWRSTDSEPLVQGRGYDDDRLAKAQRVAIWALLGYVLLQGLNLLPTLMSVGGLSGILAGSGDAWRRAYLAISVEQAQTGFTGSSLGLGLLGYALYLGAVSIYWAGYFARLGRWRLSLPPVLIFAVYSLLLLQRAAFLYALLLFAFSWYYHRCFVEKRTITRSRRRVVAIASALLVPVLVIVPLQLRQPDLSSGEQASNVTTYIESGLAGLNSLQMHDPTLRAAQPQDYPGEVTGGSGVWTFFGAASIAARLGLPIAIPSNFFNYVPIQRTGEGLSNTYTFILYFYYDAGWAGIVVLSFLLGLGATFAHRRLRVGLDLRYLPLACVLMTSISMSFFGITMLRDVRYIFLVVAGSYFQARLTGSSETSLFPPHVAEGARRA